ncbi:MAG: DUF1508 domain-containing protein [Bacillota bacterium]|nr:DUF1508 domain-containing protein [Bacillota bacterium]
MQPEMKSEVQPEPNPTPQPEPNPIPQPEPKPEVQPEPKPEVQPEPMPVAEPQPKSEVKPVEQPAAPVKPVPVKAEAPKSSASGRYSGKYEVFPEAGLFKYRLKASNGEILVVSQGYSTRNGATIGIDTFKKNVEGGLFDVYTDKSGFSQFMLFNANKSRLMATGEFYETDARVQSAIESVKKFVSNDKIIQLDEIPADEIREELVKLSPVDLNDNGKIEIAVDEKKEWTFTLKASNGEVLFESNGYASKPGAMMGFESVKKAVEAGNFRVSQDKQNRFQFSLYAPNNTMVLTGETYPSLENCLSAVDSVRRFLPNAKIIDKPAE